MINPSDFNSLRIQAKKLRTQQKWLEAIELYENIFSIDCDRWIAWEYADCLKKLSDLDKAIEISKSLLQRDRNFVHNNNFLSWLLYEKYFKTVKEDYSFIDLNQLYEIALSISTFTTQNDKSALENVIFQMLRIFKKHSNNSSEKMLNLLQKLDVDKLSEVAGKYERNGREQEYQSRKEMYYSLKTKALLDCRKYEEGIACCEEAISTLHQFHHNNQTWFLARKAMCIAGIGNADTAISDLKEAVIQKNHWSLFEGIASIYLTANDRAMGLLYYCRAAITQDQPHMKVNLYFEISKLLLDIGDIKNAWKHLYFAKSIREQEGWNISLNMKNMHKQLCQYGFSTDVKLTDLVDFWLDTIYKFLGVHSGIVCKINPNHKIGFIESEKQSYFFKTSSVVGKLHLKEKDHVVFCLVDSYDTKKKQKSVECDYIKFDNNCTR